jgi:hypothetical protein
VGWGRVKTKKTHFIVLKKKLTVIFLPILLFRGKSRGVLPQQEPEIIQPILVDIADVYDSTAESSRG